MVAAYLHWLEDLFEEAQVPFRPDTAEYLDASLRRIANSTDATEEEVLNILRKRWLRHGEPGRQLLAGLLRSQVYSRRDSPLRPSGAVGYYTNPK
jgi:hypothetical protein